MLGQRPRLVHQRGVVEVGRREDARHRPADAQPAHQGARVDPLDADDAVLAQVGVERRGRERKLLGTRVSSRTMKPSTCGRRDSPSSAVDAVVADERVGHRDDLALVGRIGEHLLVAGHAGVEDDLAEGLAGGAEAAAGVDGAVFEGQFRQHAVIVTPSSPAASRRVRQRHADAARSWQRRQLPVPYGWVERHVLNGSRSRGRRLLPLVGQGEVVELRAGLWPLPESAKNCSSRSRTRPESTR